MRKKLIIFIPSIEGGGVEKNLFIISDYLKHKIKNISVITLSNKYKNRFVGINFISPKANFWSKIELYWTSTGKCLHARLTTCLLNEMNVA